MKASANSGISRSISPPSSRIATVARQVMTIIAYVFVFWIALPAFLLITGFRIDQLWTIQPGGGIAVDLLGGLLVAAGTSILLTAIVHLGIAGQGLPISHLPPTRLVRAGIFRYVRHPIYLGYTIAFAGASVLLGSFWSFAFSTPLLFVGWIAYALYAEEPVLIERFGDQYRRYRRRTRLILPFAKRERRNPAPSRFAASFWSAVNRLANRTILLHRGNLILVTYGALCSVGALIFAVWLASALVQHGLPHSHVAVLLVGTAFSTCFLGWVFWWIGNLPRLLHQRFWGLGQVGFVSYGGLAGVLLFPIAFAFIAGYAPLMIADCISLGLYWAYAIGRLGCLSFGCCYGRPTEHEHGVVYENPDAKVIRTGDHRHVARIPTQLYSFAHGLLLVIILNAMTWGAVPAGLVTAVGLMLVGLGRMFTEAYRDRERPILGRFTYGQLGSWVTFIVGWLFLWLASPGIDESAPLPPSAAAFADSLDLLPYALLAALVVLIIAGLHWKRVGTWIG